ncbi:MAG: 1,4-dihydroxy-6-naphthoate synthase [Nannocystis sp.]|nr:1,4-dihydroxy-6-naphthoate synthase [Nannocystis sp.]MBA3545612.1 1,4-dihydroxy-6-naphthoate synthase [Nannocystis sp.]
MSDALAIGFSPCPNDTFMFHALVAGEVPGLRVRPWLADIEALNLRALGDDPLPVTKLSVHALAHVRERYTVLASGAALGRGCGPLVVSRPQSSIAGDPAEALQRLRGRRVAIPGRYTTAYLLLRALAPELTQVVPMRFEAIMPAVAAGEVDAGLIIHESRFTFATYGLVQVADLGALWEVQSGLPLPLGVIAVQRSLGAEVASALEAGILGSILAARARPEAAWPYILAHAQEMNAEVCRQHIALYVNDFSLALGDEGRAAIDALLARGEAAGLLPAGPAVWR